MKTSKKHPPAAKVSLREAAEMFERISSNVNLFFNTRTGEFDVQFEHFDFEQEPKTYYKKDGWISAPCRWDLHEHGIMARFCETVADPHAQELLDVALHGKGAFRRFKDVLHRTDLTKEWYAFKHQAFVSTAKKWCEAKNLEYVDDTNPPAPCLPENQTRPTGDYPHV
jgi:hypothetical protein